MKLCCFRRQLNLGYQNLREVIPEKFGLTARSTSPSQPDIVQDCGKSNSSKWQVLSKAKDYVQHLESVVQKFYAQSTRNQSDAAGFNTNSIGTSPSDVIEKLRQNFLEDFSGSPEKPMSEYSFDFIESTVDENEVPGDIPVSPIQEVSSSFTQCQHVILEEAYQKEAINSVYFIPINVKPTVNGEPMFVTTCASKF